MKKFIKNKWYQADSTIDVFIKFDRIEYNVATQVYYSEIIFQGKYSNIPNHLSSNLIEIDKILKPKVITISKLIKYLPLEDPIRIQWMRDQKIRKLFK